MYSTYSVGVAQPKVIYQSGTPTIIQQPAQHIFQAQKPTVVYQTAGTPTIIRAAPQPTLVYQQPQVLPTVIQPAATVIQSQLQSCVIGQPAARVYQVPAAPQVVYRSYY